MTGKGKKPRSADLILGPLPVDRVNRALGLELEPGDVILSAGAQRHALRRHPNGYARCLPHIAAVVTDPTFVGDDLLNPGKIELVSRVPALGAGLLVALVLERTKDGHYTVASFYPIAERVIENRRQARRLIITPRK